MINGGKVSKSPIESLIGDIGERKEGTIGKILGVFKNEYNFVAKIGDNLRLIMKILVHDCNGCFGYPLGCRDFLGKNNFASYVKAFELF